MLEYLKDRMGEASTWRGVVAMLTAGGIVVAPELAESIVALGLSLIGVFGIATADKK